MSGLSENCHEGARMDERVAYKVLTAPEMAALARDEFAGAAVDRAEGYIHLSTAAQVTETVARHFAGRDDLVIAAVDLRALGEAVRWEPSRGGELFPHLYGALRMEAVIAHAALTHDREGRVRLPEITA
jgi:uncharacterized protein (DUF952 family)